MLINSWADCGLFRFQEQYAELMLTHAVNNFFDRVEWIKEIICEFTKYILKPLVFKVNSTGLMPYLEHWIYAEKSTRHRLEAVHHL